MHTFFSQHSSLVTSYIRIPPARILSATSVAIFNHRYAFFRDYLHHPYTFLSFSVSNDFSFLSFFSIFSVPFLHFILTW